MLMKARMINLKIMKLTKKYGGHHEGCKDGETWDSS